MTIDIINCFLLVYRTANPWSETMCDFTLFFEYVEVKSHAGHCDYRLFSIIIVWFVEIRDWFPDNLLITMIIDWFWRLSIDFDDCWLTFLEIIDWFLRLFIDFSDYRLIFETIDGFQWLTLEIIDQYWNYRLIGFEIIDWYIMLKDPTWNIGLATWHWRMWQGSLDEWTSWKMGNDLAVRVMKKYVSPAL